MASEIRVNTINNRSGLGTISITNSGAVFSGVTTFAQIKTTSGEVTVGTGASVFSPATNVLALGTNSVERVRIDSSGNFGIGTNNPTSLLHCSQSNDGITSLFVKNENTGTSARSDVIVESDSAQIRMLAASAAYTGVSGWADAGIIATSSASSNGLILEANQGGIKFTIQNSEKLRIDTSGRLLVGANTTAGNQGDADLLVQGSTTQGELYLSRGSTPANSGGGLGFIAFTGGNGADAAFIRSYSDGGTWTNGSSHPSLLRFDTTTDGASTPTERMRINSAGNIGLGNGVDADTKLELSANNAGAVQNNVIRFTDTDASFQAGQSPGRIEWNTSDANSPGVTAYIDTYGYTNAVSDLVFGTGAGGSATERLRILHTGNVNIANGNLVFSTSGTGIDFSANGNAAGMTSELLDDYEEGTWTPTFGSTDGTTIFPYDVQKGYYTKIGNLVRASFAIRTTGNRTAGPSTGILQVRGFPFTSFNNGGDSICSLTVGYLSGFTSYGTSTNTMSGIMYSNDDKVQLYNLSNSSAATGPAPTNVTNLTAFRGTIVYQAAS